MEYGIGMLSVVPMRAETSDRAEIVTQLLFGECYEVVERKDNWLCLQLATDGYRGWVDYKLHTPVSAAYYQEWCQTKHPRVVDLLQLVHQGDVQIPVGIGAYLPFFDGKAIRVDEQRLHFKGIASGVEAAPAQVTEVAQRFLKFPYLWGGKSVFGIDCSGFTQLVFGICGYQLPRDAYQQVLHGEEVHFVAQAQAGDLAYFSNTEGRIIHVGIVLEEQQIMHAHGEVRVDKLDHSGIYNHTLSRYTHNLRIIKRISF